MGPHCLSHVSIKGLWVAVVRWKMVQGCQGLHTGEMKEEGRFQRKGSVWAILDD